MTDNLELLNEYEAWSRTEAVKGRTVSPREFLDLRHTASLLAGLARALKDGRDDRYPMEEYLREEDIAWLESQEFAAVSVD